jgi:hypothetical protein
MVDSWHYRTRFGRLPLSWTLVSGHEVAANSKPKSASGVARRIVPPS